MAFRDTVSICSVLLFSFPASPHPSVTQQNHPKPKSPLTQPASNPAVLLPTGLLLPRGTTTQLEQSTQVLLLAWFLLPRTTCCTQGCWLLPPVSQQALFVTVPTPHGFKSLHWAGEAVPTAPGCSAGSQVGFSLFNLTVFSNILPRAKGLEFPPWGSPITRGASP